MLVLDGRPIRSYTPLSLRHGRVVGPIEPYLTRVAQRIDVVGNYLVLTRGSHHVSVAAMAQDAGLAQTEVALAPLLRGLGERVVLNAPAGRIEVTSPQAVTVADPMPFDPRAPQVAPVVVFTPTPAPTPRLTWTGTPVPRRTPIPLGAWATPKPPN
jgi:hypothetical protein